jgi:hypothetical protein
MPSMPQSSGPSQASSDPNEVVVGVDTHKDVHVAAVLTALGVLLESKKFPATAAGYQALGVGRHVRGPAAGRSGVHWLLRCGTGPVPASGRCRGDRGQPARQGHPSPARQDRHPRRRSRCPGSSQRPGQRQRQSR